MSESSAEQALEGIRVLDLADSPAGTIGALLLAEQGADVIRVEPPGGSPARSDVGDRVWGRSRRSVELDLESDGGRQQFLALVATADLVVECFTQARLAELGIGWTTLSRVNPRAILVSCPAYPHGHRLADRPAHDALVQARTGLMWAQPGWRDGPIYLRFPAPTMAAASLVASGSLAALVQRAASGRGQHVRTSLLQGSLLFTTQLYQEVEHAPAAYHELMGKTYPPGIHQPTIFQCANGEWVHLSLQSGLPPVLSVDEILGESSSSGVAMEGFLSPEERADNARRRAELIRRWDRDTLVATLRANDHAVEPVVAPGDGLRHPQTVANEMAVTIDDPDLGPLTQVGVPIHLLATPGRVRGPRPQVGADNAAVLGLLPSVDSGAGQGPAVEARAVMAADPVAAPLAGIRVLDFGQFLAGPFGPMVLGDLGADVLKIEPPGGDAMRRSGKPFVGCQRGKRSLALDLKTTTGTEVAHRLIAGADVVHHNMTRGVADRLGIGYATCRSLRPDVIYCNTYAYGLPDPLGRFGGIDPLFQASSGLEHDASGAGAENPPLYLRFGMTDTANAMLSVAGVLLALVHRGRTGSGQQLWTSLHDAALMLTSDAWLDKQGHCPDRPELDANQLGVDAYQRLYRCAGGGWICVAARTGEEISRLLDVLGAPIGTDAADLAERFLTRTAQTWHRLLDDRLVPNEIPLDTEDGLLLLHDDDNVRLGLVAEYDHRVLGRIRQFGSLVDFGDGSLDAAAITTRTPPPLVGEHSRAVLRELGYRDGDVDAMISAGVVYEPDAAYRERFAT